MNSKIDSYIAVNHFTSFTTSPITIHLYFYIMIEYKIFFTLGGTVLNVPTCDAQKVNFISLLLSFQMHSKIMSVLTTI